MVAGARFVRGVVLCGGTEAAPFGRKLHALPVDALWRLGSAWGPPPKAVAMVVENPPPGG